MELRVLRYFLVVAREGSISKAAEYLNMTQPPLSRQLMDLEDEIGKKLLIRGNRKITLTEEGMLLRKRATEILNLVEKTESELTHSNEIISGEVHIGSGETDAMRMIAKVAKEMNIDYPNIRYNLFSGNAHDVTEQLDKGLLDFAILIEPGDIKKYDFIRLPVSDVWGVLMRKDSHLSKKDNITSKDLASLPIIFSKQSLVENELSGWFREDFKNLNIICTYNLIYNASLMVDEGLGYALCLDKLINTTGNSSLTFRPLEPRLEAHLYIIWKKSQVFSRSGELFLKKLQDFLIN